MQKIYTREHNCQEKKKVIIEKRTKKMEKNERDLFSVKKSVLFLLLLVAFNLTIKYVSIQIVLMNAVRTAGGGGNNYNDKLENGKR